MPANKLTSPAKAAQGDPLATPKEAAAYLKVSESYLAKARMRGTGPAFVQLGRAVRYSRAALEAFMAAQTRISTSEGARPASQRQAHKQTSGWHDPLHKHGR